MVRIGHTDYKRHTEALKLYAINKRVERNESLVETKIKEKHNEDIYIVVNNDETSESIDFEISKEDLFKNLIAIKMFELKQELDNNFY